MKTDKEYIDRLIGDFKKKYPKLDYFSLKEIVQYMNMAYCIGVDDATKVFTKNNCIPVVRSDGEEYPSIQNAANKNNINERSIRRALEKGTISAGHYWRINSKSRTNYIKTQIKWN